MKIEKIAFNDTAEMVIGHPVTGEPLPATGGGHQTITLYGIQSNKYRAAEHDILNKRMGRRNKDITAEQVADDGTDMLAACTKSFNGVDFGDGIIDTKKAKETYLDHPWLKSDVDKFMAGNKHFLVKSKAS